MLSPPPFHTLREPCEFYFVRHGESESNKVGRIQGHTDSPLSELGRTHAEAAGRWFEGKEIDTVLTSPLARARETAQIISRHAGTPEPLDHPGLIELNTGIYSNVSIRGLREIDPELFREFRIHSWEVVPEAERIASLQARAATVWDELVRLARKGARRFVCVSHGGMIQWLIKATIGAGEQRWMPLFETSNCGIFLFRAESTLPGHRHHAGGELSDSNAMAADEAPSGIGAFGAGSDGGSGDEDAAPAGTPPTEPPLPGTGYYGVWALINHVPYTT
ncbi:MAG: histidine phosphatase family protein [Spirochaetota bacterium]